MNRRALRLCLLGAGAYLVFLVATFPAQYLVNHLAKSEPQLQLTGVTGTLFSGSAAEVRYEGAALGSVGWRFDWLAPFTLSFGYHFDLTAEDRALHGRVDLGLGRIYLRGLEGRVPVSTLEHWLPIPPDSATGYLSLHLDQLVFKGGRLIGAQGSVDLDEAVLKWPAAASLGSFHMDLSPSPGGGFQAAIADAASPLKLRADLSFSPEGVYHLRGTLSARDAGDSATRNLLANLGRADSTGQYPFDFKGQW